MKMLDGLGLEASEIRLPGQLDCIDGLIIPGGESTTIVQLMDNFGLTDRLKFLIKSGLPTWGTCAGMIVLAKDNRRQTYTSRYYGYKCEKKCLWKTN